MKLRGRRVVLILAGAFPLLADETELENQGDKFDLDSWVEEGEKDPVEAIHYDTFRIPPLPSATKYVEEKDDESNDLNELVPERPDIAKRHDSGSIVAKTVDIDVENTNNINDRKISGHEDGLLQEKLELVPGALYQKLDKVSAVVDQILERVSSFDQMEAEPADSRDPDIITAESCGDAASEESQLDVESEDEIRSYSHELNSTLDEKGDKVEEDVDNATETIENGEADAQIENRSDVSEALIIEKPTEHDRSDEQDPTVDKQQSDDDEDTLTDRVAVDYASKSAGALILEKSNSIQGTSNLLNSDKDRYAIAPCEDKKFVVIGLSEDILVKQIILANYERFSSRVKDFQVMGSQTMGKWVDLGTYSARAGNGEQIFDLVEPAWARYLKFKFLSHHGSEYYCTVSQIKVHGSTMLQGFHEQWEDAENNDDSGESKGAFEKLEDPATDEMIDDSSNPEGGGVEESTTVLEKNDCQSDAAGQVGCSDASVGETAEDGDTTNTLDSEGDHDLGMFRESKLLDDMLHGTSVDEELFETIYDLIPLSLNSRPAESLNSPGRKKESDLRTVHQLSTAAVESVFGLSPMASNRAKPAVQRRLCNIVVPRMSDSVEDVFKRVKASIAGKDVGISSEAGTPPQDSKLRPSHPAVDEQVVETKNGTKYQEWVEDERQRSIVNNSAADIDAPLEDENGMVPSTSKEPTEAIDASHSSIPERTREQDMPVATDGANAADQTLARMLERRLPSADCLTGLDYSEFKSRVVASRKASGGTGTTHGGSEKEPIFKKLTDEIKALQTSLSVHDQFTKASVSCYQRVLVDLVADMETMRVGHEERLLRLEEELSQRKSSILWKISSWVLGWVSLAFRGVLSVPSITMETATALTNYIGRFISSNIAMPLNDIAPTPNLRELASRFGVDDVLDRSETEQLKWVIPAVPAFGVLIVLRVIVAIASRTRGNRNKLPVGEESTGTEAGLTTKSQEGPVFRQDVPSIIEESPSKVLDGGSQAGEWGSRSKLLGEESAGVGTRLETKGQEGALFMQDAPLIIEESPSRVLDSGSQTEDITTDALQNSL